MNFVKKPLKIILAHNQLEGYNLSMRRCTEHGILALFLLLDVANHLVEKACFVFLGGIAPHHNDSSTYRKSVLVGVILLKLPTEEVL